MQEDSPARNLRSRKKSINYSPSTPKKTVKKGNKKSKPEGLSWYSKGYLSYCNFDEAPEYMQDNAFIVTGYRAGYSYKESFISLFHLHNETGNIWTHLLGFFFFAYLVFYSWNAPELVSLHVEDKIVLTIFLCLSCYTLIFSSLLHLHICVSSEAHRFWSCLDHSGISASIGGGSIALMYILLHCHGSMRFFWIGLLILANSVGVIGPLFSFWTKPSFRVYRSLIYIASGAATVGPIMYYIFHEGTSKLPLDLNENFAVGHFFLMAFQYVFGAFIYASRIPERFWPGKFDYYFSSHQIWHVFVVTGSFTVWRTIIDLIKWKMSDLEMCL